MFRLCVGNATSEDIVLGNLKRSDSAFNETFPYNMPPSAAQLKAMKSKQSIGQTFARRRQTTDTQAQSACIQNILVSRYCNADIYSPLGKDETVLNQARLFIRRAQASLSGKVNLNQVECWKLDPSMVSSIEVSNYENAGNRPIYLQKRVGASYSCLFIACLLDIAFNSSLFSSKSRKDDNLPLLEYLNQMINVIEYVYLLCLRMSTIRAINGRQIVMQVSPLKETKSCLR